MLALVVAVIATLATIAAVRSTTQKVEAQPAPFELATICLEFSTGLYRGSFSGACPPGHQTLALPDAYPLTLCASAYDGLLRRPLSNGQYQPPTLVRIDLPSSTPVNVCYIYATGRLRVPTPYPNGSCGSGISGGDVEALASVSSLQGGIAGVGGTGVEAIFSELTVIGSTIEGGDGSAQTPLSGSARALQGDVAESDGGAGIFGAAAYITVSDGSAVSGGDGADGDDSDGGDGSAVTWADLAAMAAHRTAFPRRAVMASWSSMPMSQSPAPRPPAALVARASALMGSAAAMVST